MTDCECTRHVLAPHLESMLSQAIDWDTFEYGELPRTICFVKWRGPPPAIIRACDEGGIFPEEENILVHFKLVTCDNGPIFFADMRYKVFSVSDVSVEDEAFILQRMPFQLTKQQWVNVYDETHHTYKKKWQGKTNFGLSRTGVALVVDLF